MNFKFSLLLFVAFTFLSSAAFSQAPNLVNYQAVARNLSGVPLVSQSISVVIEIRQGSANGGDVYKESHPVTTNAFGLFTLEIGGGNAVAPYTTFDFSNISWGTSSYYLYIEVDGDPIGSSQLLSVPYALYSKESANGPTGAQGPPGVGINWLGTFTAVPTAPNLNDAYYNSSLGQSFIWDGNAWQILAQDGVIGSLVGGPGISIVGSTINNTGDLDSTNELQTLNYNPTTQNLAITNGNSVILNVDDADNDPTNEIELPITGVVNDVLTWNGLAWVATAPNSGTDNQNLINGGKAGNNQTINIQNGSGFTFSVADGDSSNFNEYNTSFNINGSNLELVDGGNTFQVPLSNFADNDWLTGTGVVYNTSANIGIGTNVPTEKLDVNGKIRMRTGAVNGYIPVSNTNGVMTWTDPLTISTAGFWASTNTGTIHPTTLSDRVGIGTNAPLERLHVFETTNLDVLLESSTGIIDLVLDAAVNRANILFKRSGLLVGSVGYDIANSHLFLNDGVESLVSQGGNIGIGTNSPSSKLEVNGNTNILSSSGDPLVVRSSIDGFSFTVKESDNGFDAVRIFGYGTRGRMLMNNNGVTTVNFDANATLPSYINAGNFGLGTTTPSSKLNIVTSVNTTLLELEGSGLVGGGLHFTYRGTAEGYEIRADDQGGINMEASGNHKISFETSGTERVRITGAGNVGIGTTSPSKKLHVVKNPTTTYDAAIYGSSVSTNGNGFYGAMAYDGGTTDYGVFAHSDALSNTSPLGVSRAADGALVNFLSGGNVEGQIYVSGNTVTYGAFTGVHYGLTDVVIETGKLVTLTGKNENYHGNPNSEILYGVTESIKANDSKIMGTYFTLIDNQLEQSLDNPHQIMAVGNGAMWVVDNGKDLQPGDYLISSDTKGHAMLDKGGFDVSYIIARVSEPINWDEVTEMVNGKKHKKITVFFESFVINHKANNLEKEVEALKNNFKSIKVEIEELKKYSVVGIKN